jgi:hypothetical protein
MFAQSGDGAFQIHGVPENDGGDNQVQAAGAISVVLETAVAEVALAVEEDGTRESVSGFAFVEAYLDTPAERMLRSRGRAFAGELQEPILMDELAKVGAQFEIANML